MRKMARRTAVKKYRKIVEDVLIPLKSKIR